MKYKYIGENNTYCLELLAYNIMKKKDKLKKGQVIEIPEDKANVISALDASGVFVKLDFNKNTTKKSKKGE